jgi:hypothetical protein
MTTVHCQCISALISTKAKFTRPPSRLNITQLNHLLHQFTTIPSRDHQLYGFLLDVQQCMHIIRAMNTELKDSKRALSTIVKHYRDYKFRGCFTEARKNPTGKVTNKILAKLSPLLTVAGRNMSLFRFTIASYLRRV